MRSIVVILLLSFTAADAQTIGEWSGLNRLLGRPRSEQMYSLKSISLTCSNKFRPEQRTRGATPLYGRCRSQNRTQRKPVMIS